MAHRPRDYDDQDLEMLERAAREGEVDDDGLDPDDYPRWDNMVECEDYSRPAWSSTDHDVRESDEYTMRFGRLEERERETWKDRNG